MPTRPGHVSFWATSIPMRVIAIDTLLFLGVFVPRPWAQEPTVLGLHFFSFFFYIYVSCDYRPHVDARMMRYYAKYLSSSMILTASKPVNPPLSFLFTYSCQNLDLIACAYHVPRPGWPSLSTLWHGPTPLIGQPRYPFCELIHKRHPSITLRH